MMFGLFVYNRIVTVYKDVQLAFIFNSAEVLNETIEKRVSSPVVWMVTLFYPSAPITQGFSDGEAWWSSPVNFSALWLQNHFTFFLSHCCYCVCIKSHEIITLFYQSLWITCVYILNTHFHPVLWFNNGAKTLLRLALTYCTGYIFLSQDMSRGDLKSSTTSIERTVIEGSLLSCSHTSCF